MPCTVPISFHTLALAFVMLSVPGAMATSHGRWRDQNNSCQPLGLREDGLESSMWCSIGWQVRDKQNAPMNHIECRATLNTHVIKNEAAYRLYWDGCAPRPFCTYAKKNIVDGACA